MSVRGGDVAIGRNRAARRPVHAIRAVGDVRESHGGRKLATGITIAAAFIIAAHLVHAWALAPYFPPGPGPWPAWIALAAVVAAGVVARMFARQLPDWLYIALLVALAVPVWLGVASTAGLLSLGITPTAAPAAGAVLMPVAAIRGSRIPVIAASIIAAILAVEALAQLETADGYVVVGLAVASTAVLPVLLVSVALTGFRRLVGRELDLSLVQSTVGTARSAVGMRASEELAQLDFDAETLLDDVGSGRIAIPLPPDAAERAGSLAARLRVRLIEGRTDTWLRHAVTESAYLVDRVTVTDPTGSAGLLSQSQRDGLLLALWLIVAEPDNPSGSPLAITVTCREASDETVAEPSFDMSIDVSGVSRRRVDPGTWDAIGSVGEHTVTAAADGFRIDITCRVQPNPHTGNHRPVGPLDGGGR